ncbi:MAG: alpha/beta hydrolase family protein, partial [Owenweeksia sp.]
MRFLSTAVLILALTASGFSQKLVSVQYLSTTNSGQLKFLFPDAQFDVAAYKVVYNTVDIDGTPTVASGALMIPINNNCDQFPLISYNHGTVLLKEDVPSRDNTEAIIPKLMASLGKIAVCPDYLGLGDNPGLHPYLHAESEATASIDLMRAVREYVRDSLTISLNGEVFITGYSQGGHAAMATAKYIQDNNLTAEFNVLAVGPASGPYNLSGTQSQLLLSNAPYSNPGYVCYLLFGLNRVYGDLYTSYSDILKAPYDQIIPPYFNGTYPMDSVNAKLPAKLSDFIQDTVLANFSSASGTKNHPLWQALIKNDNYDWTPAMPMELYYCTQDEQVAF